MGGFSNTTYKDTINSIVTTSKEFINNPYYLWANKSPTIVNYYSINKQLSTLDEGSLLEYSNVGEYSPLRFNKIEDFIIYGLEQIQTSLVNEEFGLQTDGISGEAFILPNTITPCSGDYFSITYLKEKIIFKIIETTFDTLDNGGNIYKITYELSSDSEERLEQNVCKHFHFLPQNIGTGYNCVIEMTVKEQVEKIDAVIEMLKEYFVSLFYSERVQTFTFRFLENNFYDPYMIEFLIRNEIINFNGDEYVYIGHQTRLSPMFPLEYKKTLFYALEKRDKNNIRYYKTKAMGCAIKAHMTTFYSRPETYFELNYDPITKDWGIVPTFFDECIDHIESGELFDIDDGNFYAYNIIIKYFNDMDINVTDLELIERFDLKQHHMLFYIIPSIIFCLNKQLDDLMQKE